jgi:hypothetical protein
VAVEKRYQVFVSSTFLDLIEERKEVMQALLELDCIPSGMELFQAADEDQWSLIKRVIDDCDYYLVIIGGRYGSISAEGVSFTEMEYRYALESGKPAMAFLHDNPGNIAADKTEDTPEGREKLEKFRALCQQKVVRYWSSPEGLGSVVSRSIIKLIKDRPAVGWVRGDALLAEDASQEILRLRRRIDELNSKAVQATVAAPEGTAHLLQLTDDFPVKAIVMSPQPKASYRTDKFRFGVTVRLEAILKLIGPYMIDEITERRMDTLVDDSFVDLVYPHLKNSDEIKDRSVSGIEADPSTFQEIKVQLMALGIITKGDKRRPPSDSNVYWRLTPYGEALLMKLTARRKFDDSGFSELGAGMVDEPTQ